MCLSYTIIGVIMLIVGAFLIVRYFIGKGAKAPDVAGPARTEFMLLGAVLTSLGFLILVLGTTGLFTCPGF